MFKFVACATIVLLMTGCATNNHPVETDGRTVHEAKCDDTPGPCIKEAMTRCWDSYDMVALNPTRGGRTQMLYKCRFYILGGKKL